MTFKPSELTTYLQQLVTQKLPISTMIWGPPGIGKSSIVAQVAEHSQLAFIDVRLSQLAPTDLRGLPVAVPPKPGEANGTSTWYPPEFLPRDGKGILFLDELNMAPPALSRLPVRRFSSWVSHWVRAPKACVEAPIRP